ncbi:MAG: class I SAM-dependent methyltransferase [Opitutales bacterium]|jgi:ubiquinone/menaquinone biosynthesis C-methylase UbiE|nr:class I SAM-dependent methyltransferase [Opitutales bacterium]
MAKNPVESIARSYFESKQVVDHYFMESHRVGLWQSESRLFQSSLQKNDRILDLGCGTGRIAFGLENLGYTSVSGADYSSGMVAVAKQIAESLGSKLSFIEADARCLPWSDGEFDGVIFGFNGFFMIPGHEERLKALKEIHRVLKPGCHFIFTGHDRELSNQRDHWQNKEAAPPTGGVQQGGDTEFGDVVSKTELGTMYIHSTSTEFVELMLLDHGFENVETWLRSELGNESALVRNFSDECRFWTASKMGN